MFIEREAGVLVVQGQELLLVLHDGLVSVVEDVAPDLDTMLRMLKLTVLGDNFSIRPHKRLITSQLQLRRKLPVTLPNSILRHSGQLQQLLLRKTLLNYILRQLLNLERAQIRLFRNILAGRDFVYAGRPF